ncbi:MAG TPA: DsbA family protein, partial [Aestuariivirgaceae bacterium]|nr:DsbA family protein [Aestuariivirgaceae bacterium]
AEAVGLDPATVRTSLEARDLRPEVEQEIAAAVRLGVTGVPTFVVANRYAVVGAQDPRYIAGAISRARADAAAAASPA